MVKRFRNTPRHGSVYQTITAPPVLLSRQQKRKGNVFFAVLEDDLQDLNLDQTDNGIIVQLRQPAIPFCYCIVSINNKHQQRPTVKVGAGVGARERATQWTVDPNEQAVAAEANQHRSERSECYTDPGPQQHVQLHSYSRTTAGPTVSPSQPRRRRQGYTPQQDEENDCRQRQRGIPAAAGAQQPGCEEKPYAQ